MAGRRSRWVTNQDKIVRLIRHQWSGLIKATERGERRVHPTQKPVALAEWVIVEETYAGSARGTLKLLGFDADDTTVNQAREQFSLPPLDDPAGEELSAAIVEQMDRAAAAWARENAGELVGQLEESTRGMLAEDVAQAIEEGWTDADLASHLTESYAFSEARAARIAQNELAVAKRAGERIAIGESSRHRLRLGHDGR
jgi:hypothetical protein